MDRLKGLVLRLANADRVGGRVVVMDRHTLVLYDCMHWGCNLTDAVQSSFPEAQISVHSSRQSLSGFTVSFHLEKHAGRELSWFLVIGLMMASCSYLLLRPSWWDPKLIRI
jgi:hypothetical protein